MKQGHSPGIYRRQRYFHLIDQNFRKNPRPYIVQSLLAAASVIIILFFITILTHAAIVAALGSSAFVVFAMPRYATAQPRRLVGGHIVGILCGLVGYYLIMTGPIANLGNHSSWLQMIAAAVAVGLSILLMPILNTEHPPAAGTAIGIASVGWQWEPILFIIVFALMLSVIRFFLLSRLRDLV